MNHGLLATRQGLTDLRGHIGRRPYDAMYALLEKRCALILQSRPVTETDWRSAHAQGLWGAALTAARTCQGRVFDLCICSMIDANAAYRDRAIEELRLLAGWSAWLDPSREAENEADLCTAECCATMAVGLDWLAEDMAEVDRLRCRRALQEKGLAAYRRAIDNEAWWYDCYHNWNAVINSGCGLGALALIGEDETAEATVETAHRGLEHFFAALGREGGWDEGIGYWGYALRYLLLFGRALDRRKDDRSIFYHRGMESTCQFGIYFTPRGHSTSFGDSPAAPLYGALYAAAKRYGSREVCWWLDRWAFHRDVTTTGWSDIGLGLLLRPTEMEAEPTPSLSPLKVFNEIGWAAVADHWPEPSLYVSIKSGDLSANHSHLDMNTIQIQIDGETIIADMGNPPMTSTYCFSREGLEAYETQAPAHNTLTVDDRDHRIDARGQIVEAEQTARYRWVASSAGQALGETVRFNRHIIMLLDPLSGHGHTVVVVDEVTNAVAEKIAARWHTFGELNFAGDHGVIVGRHSGLHLRIGATAPFSADDDAHTLGKLTARVLTVKFPKTEHVVMATAFSRRPLRDVSLRESSRGEVHLTVDEASLHFKGSRRHLKLDQVTVDESP